MFNRRKLILMLGALSGLTALGGLVKLFSKDTSTAKNDKGTNDMKLFPLNTQWSVLEPFIFFAYHHDKYPVGTKAFGPDHHDFHLRDMGQDFGGLNGYSMYHGEQVPGFPVHPHRGFETITIVRKGYVDHSDSLGAAGRYGEGDVQWMTAGSGVQHSEMFPLLKQNEPNTLELFQIWLNLPKKSKKVPPHFTMLWSEKIPKAKIEKENVGINVIAGEFGGERALPPPPDSWAADPENEVSILILTFNKNGKVKIPKSKSAVNRVLYFFEGEKIVVNGQEVPAKTGVQISSTEELEILNPSGMSEVLMLQAKPIGEPVFQHGPFVMNTREDIIQTIEDYNKTQFGGWPWKEHEMTHGPKLERFAKYPDGRIEKPV
jgi:redox-sensitive bicupin YhaK (pirin superfamily)